MNYSIVKDEEILRDFINWLPDLERDETYYCALFSRKKYTDDPNIKSDKSQLKRFTTKKEYLFQKLKQVETEVGTYYQDKYPIPQDSLSVYISVNPRSFVKAAKNGLITLANLITKDYSGYNPHQVIMSEIQKAWGRKIFIDFDFDFPLEKKEMDIDSIKNKIFQYVNKEAVNILLTRGGFHVLIETLKIEKEFEKTWYKNIFGLSGVDVKGDNLIPIPGCFQGGFVPYFLKK